MYDEELYPQRPRRNAMTTAALTFGVLSLITFSIIYLSVPCAALAILFGILSRNNTMPMRSRAGIICGIIGMILSVTVTVISVRYIFSNPQSRDYLEYLLQIYTDDPDLSLEDITGELLPSQGEPDQEAPGQSPIITPDGKGNYI